MCFFLPLHTTRVAPIIGMFLYLHFQVDISFSNSNVMKNCALVDNHSSKSALYI